MISLCVYNDLYGNTRQSEEMGNSWAATGNTELSLGIYGCNNA